MNILMIYPEFPDTFWSFKHALNFIHRKASSPPLGLVTVAAMLPADWNKRLVDMNVTQLRQKDLEWADLVFLSAMVVQRESAVEVIARCKASGVKIVAGGPLFTGEYEAFPDVDYFVLNEGEITLPMFLDDFEQGHAQHLYMTRNYANLEETPVPVWKLVDMKQYDSMSIQFSRGCPFNCDFCNITAMLGHVPRIKKAAQIIAELDAIYNLGWRRNIFFVDDNFIGNKKMLKEEVLPALIEWRKGKKGCLFITEVSINLSDDPELMEMMALAGFTSIFVGIETPDEESLAECGKGQNRNRNLVESVKRLQRNGLQVMGGFIVGFDNDGPSIFQRQIDFIQKSGIVTAMVGMLQAPYGTRLYSRLEEEGRLVKEMSGDNTDGSTNIIPRMELDALKQGYARIMTSIYSPKLFYDRVREFLKEYKPVVPVVQMEWQEFLALFRSMFRIGIMGEGAIHYWKLFFETLFTEPKKFPLAITFSIYGHHFRTVNRINGLKWTPEEGLLAGGPRMEMNYSGGASKGSS